MSPEPLRIVMGTPIWGDHYIRIFTDFTLPSIFELENAMALRGRCTYIVYAKKENARTLDAICDLASDRTGLDMSVVVLPAEVACMDTWTILGWCHRDLLQRAATIGAGFHMTACDIVYSKGYFARLLGLARRHPVILHHNLWADLNAITVDLDDWRYGDTLAVSYRRLGDMGWRNLHPMYRRLVVNRPDNPAIPRSHLLAWHGRSAIHIHCAHMNAEWLSTEFCQKAIFDNTLDACLPSVIPPETKIYVPSLEDGLVLLEIADNKPEHVEPVSLQDWCKHMKWIVDTDHVRFMDCETVIPINHDPHGMSKEQIAAAYRMLRDQLVGEITPQDSE